MATLTLLGMPREILDKILKNIPLVGVVDLCHLSRDNYQMARIFEDSEASAQLLRICKTIYEAGVPVLYGDNILFFSHFFTLEDWLLKQHQQTKTAIKYILTLHLHSFHTKSCEIHTNMRNTLPNLREVFILG